MGEIVFKSGEKIVLGGKEHTFLSIANAKNIFVKNDETGEISLIPLCDVIVELENNESQNEDEIKVGDLSVEEEAEAEAKLELIKPLFDSGVTRQIVKKQAEKAVIAGYLKKGDIATLYNWKNKFIQSGGDRSSLIKTKPMGGYGKSRFHKDVEEKVNGIIKIIYEKQPRTKPVEVARQVHKVIIEMNLKGESGELLAVPSEKTIKRRILRQEPKKVYEILHGKKRATEKFTFRGLNPRKGAFPWQIIQIDSHDMDVIAVDTRLGRVTRRAWITVAIDCSTRIVVGFVVSFSPPNSVILGTCIAIAMLPKETLLQNLGLPPDAWPVNGRPTLIQVDNALQHHGSAFERGCRKNKIKFEYRPLKNPKYGGYIESFFNTFGKFIHTLQGTTFSNVKEKADYDSCAEAVYSLLEIERKVAEFIVITYNTEHKHSGLGGRTPLAAYDNQVQKYGLPPIYVGKDATKLLLDFMPYIVRTVQEKYGIRYDHRDYNSVGIQKYATLGGKIVNNQFKKAKYKMIMHPLTISFVYLFDEKNDVYVQAQETKGFPIVSPEMFKHIKNALKSMGLGVTPETVGDVLDRIWEILEKASNKGHKPPYQVQKLLAEKSVSETTEAIKMTEAKTPKIKTKRHVTTEEDNTVNVEPYEDSDFL